MQAKKTRIQGKTFPSRRDAARFMLKANKKLSQSAIARRLKISAACVCQCANGY